MAIDYSFLNVEEKKPVIMALFFFPPLFFLNVPRLCILDLHNKLNHVFNIFCMNSIMFQHIWLNGFAAARGFHFK